MRCQWCLGDGVPRTSELFDAGVPLSVGSDSGAPRDLYRVVLENEASRQADGASLVAALKRELLAFARSLADVVPARVRSRRRKE